MRLLEHRPTTALLFILGVVVLVYANSLPNDFTFDDHPIVKNNPVLAEGSLSDIMTSPFWPGQPELGLYRPVTLLSYAANRWIHGTDPLGYRVVNLMLHAVAGWALYLLLSSWFGHTAGLAGAMVFVVHPVHSESVNAIVGRAELLAGGGVLFAWYAYGRGPGGWRVLSLLAFTAACLSKEHAIVLPAFLVAEQVWLRCSGTLVERLRTVVKSAASLAPYAGVAIGALLVRVWVTGSLTIPRVPDFVDNPLAHADHVSRMWTAVGVLARYVLLLVAPLNLSVDYSFDAVPVTSFADPVVLAGFGLLAGMVSLAYRSATGEAGGVFGLGCVVFLVAWLPVSNLLFAIGTPMNERLLYLPSTGFAMLVGAGFGRLESTMRRQQAIALAAGLCLLLGVRTGIRNADWRNDFTLFAAAVTVSNDSAKAWFNFGNALRDQGNLPGALDAYGRAIEIYPEYAEVHYNRGVVLAQRGEIDRAVESYRQAVARDERHVNALNNLGILLARQGAASEAVEVLERASRAAPTRADVHFNLGLALESSDPVSAEAAYRRAIELLPGYEDAAVNLALLYRDQGDAARSVAVLERVVEANPTALRASFELGRQLEGSGRFEDTLTHYRRVWTGGREMGLLSRYRMGVVFARTGQVDSARVSLQAFVTAWKGEEVLRTRAERMLEELR